MGRKHRRKYPVTMDSGFAIRHLSESRFLVDIRKGGVKVRQVFKDLNSARVACQQQALQIRNHGLSAFTMTERQKVDAREALTLLSGHSTLVNAVQFWMRHNRPDNPAITFRELADRYVKDLELHNRRLASVRTARDKCRVLSLDFADRRVSSITRQDVEQWLASKGFSPAYRNIFVRYIKAIFNYAVDQGHVESNPIARIKKIHVDHAMPAILPVDTVKAVFRKASESYPRLIPYLAIGFFAGLRPNELQGLKWRDVDLATGHIRVLPEVAKTRRARMVEIVPNLKRWLKPLQGESDAPIVAPYMTMRRWRKQIARDCGLSGWPQDVMRHCFATYHLAVNDIQSTVRQMGHTSPNMIFDHYRGLTTAAEAARYWKILPAPQSSRRIVLADRTRSPVQPPPAIEAGPPITEGGQSVP